ncbi:phage tail protein [Sesbania bispinosa]|nr:phage tail protein [Sesbania bispinosa]
MEDLTRNLTREIKEGFDDIKREIKEGFDDIKREIGGELRGYRREIKYKGINCDRKERRCERKKYYDKVVIQERIERIVCFIQDVLLRGRYTYLQ